MADALTYEKVLEIIKETNRLSSERLEKESRKRMKEFDEELRKFEEKLEKGFEKSRMEMKESNRLSSERLEKESLKLRKEREVESHKLRKEREAESLKLRKEREAENRKRRMKMDADIRKSRKEFDKKIGEITGTLGRFVEGMVQPKLLEMFRQKGIPVTDILHSIEIHDETGQKLTEIDLLLINSIYSIAVEVKTTLTVADVDEHLRRLDMLREKPKRYVKGTILLGAVAGMMVQQDADRYAYKRGLYVLKQKGEIIKIANDDAFQPREWVIG